MYEETTNDSNGGSTVSVRFGKLEKLASALGTKMEWDHANPPRINLEKQGNVIESPSFVGKTRFHVYTRANQRVSSQDAVLKSELHDR
ncbi:hypothetical protein V1477_016405 [Vespula maculifrons]|uniref:Copper amine oxidase-like N-terminal domain-containing protein n=1 Tax=Vespula maculifrons TaxID=7453 RepID=A0ABD2BCY4_VESMC